jgi:hypothetical protein
LVRFSEHGYVWTCDDSYDWHNLMGTWYEDDPTGQRVVGQ